MRKKEIIMMIIIFILVIALIIMTKIYIDLKKVSEITLLGQSEKISELYQRIEELENMKLEESDYTEEIGNNYYENYEIVSGEHLSGKIINITDKYLKIQKENMEIKLVEIDEELTNFVNYRTQESLSLKNIKCNDYFVNNQIVRNINGQELIRENLKNIIETSSTILFVPTKIISITNMNDYYIVKIEMEDSTSEYFGKTRENRDKYEIDLILEQEIVK